MKTIQQQQIQKIAQFYSPQKQSSSLTQRPNPQNFSKQGGIFAAYQGPQISNNNNNNQIGINSNKTSHNSIFKKQTPQSTIPKRLPSNLYSLSLPNNRYLTPQRRYVLNMIAKANQQFYQDKKIYLDQENNGGNDQFTPQLMKNRANSAKQYRQQDVTPSIEKQRENVQKNQQLTFNNLVNPQIQDSTDKPQKKQGEEEDVSIDNKFNILDIDGGYRKSFLDSQRKTSSQTPDIIIDKNNSNKTTNESDISSKEEIKKVPKSVQFKLQPDIRYIPRNKTIIDCNRFRAMRGVYGNHNPGLRIKRF